MNAEKIEELQHNSDLIKISNKKIDMDNARILGELQRSIDGLVKNRHKLSQNCIDSIIISARQLKILQNIGSPYFRDKGETFIKNRVPETVQFI